ncbi:hypothetical protein ACFLVF_02770 [Chloroflexota bacterium]
MKKLFSLKFGVMVVALILLLAAMPVVADGVNLAIAGPDERGDGWTLAGISPVAPGNPPIPSRSLNIGTIEGSWYDMGFQYGQRAGEYTRYCFDDEWPGTQWLGTEKIVEYLHRWEQTTLVPLCPELIEMMHGMADGAAPELDKSPYANEITHYEKILYRQYHLELVYGGPLECRVFALTGDGIKAGQRQGQTLTVHYREGGYKGTIWSVIYTAKPSDPKAYSWWARGAGGCLVGNGGVNENGVHIGYNGSSMAYPPERDWGLSMSLTAAWALPYAKTAEDAVDLMVYGTPEYRAATERKTLLRGCALYTISDHKSIRILESSSNHYAVREPGYMGEVGNYIGASNNNWCEFSYDENDEYNTTDPMTKFGPVGPTTGSNWLRFWTEMAWLKQTYGNITIESIKDFSRSHFYCDQDGVRVYYYWDADQDRLIEAKYSGFTQCQHQSFPDTHTRGTKDVTIYELSKHGGVKIYESWGRPCEWDGPWDIHTPFKGIGK